MAVEKEMLNDGASIVALTYYGSEKTIQGYNVMQYLQDLLKPYQQKELKILDQY